MHRNHYLLILLILTLISGEWTFPFGLAGGSHLR